MDTSSRTLVDRIMSQGDMISIIRIEGFSFTNLKEMDEFYFVRILLCHCNKLSI